MQHEALDLRQDRVVRALDPHLQAVLTHRPTAMMAGTARVPERPPLPVTPTADDHPATAVRAARDAASEATKYLMTKQPQRGRAAANSEWYGHVARVYLDFYAEHGQRAVKAMARYLDAEPNTVYWWIRRAREWSFSTSLGYLSAWRGTFD